MTGPGHYREAEDLLNQPWQDAASAQMFIAQAQVHATLALAAATALNATLQLPESSALSRPWIEASQ